MTTSRLIVLLLGLMVIIQGTILYRQYSRTSPGAVPVRDTVTHVADGNVIDLTNLPSLGSPDAGLAVVEFADYECPFCMQHATEVLPFLKDQYVSTGRIRYSFANNPLSMHPNAVLLATAAICAGEQEQYWAMHDRIFALQPKGEAQLLPLAEEIGITPGAFSACVREVRDDQIERDQETAATLGISATPSFAIGFVDASNHMHVETIVTGAQPAETFQNLLDQMLVKNRTPG